MTLLTTLLFSGLPALAGSPLDGVPTYEPTPPPTLDAPKADRDAAIAIEKGLKQWLAATNPAPEVEMVQVQVDVDGTVHLDGTVADDAREREVVAKARSMDDVTGVEASMATVAAEDSKSGLSFPAMKAGADPLAPDDDVPARDAVLEALLDSVYVEAKEIRVDQTDAGRIELTGSVTSPAQRDAAGRIARETVEQPVDVDLRVRP